MASDKSSEKSTDNRKLMDSSASRDSDRTGQEGTEIGPPNANDNVLDIISGNERREAENKTQKLIFDNIRDENDTRSETNRKWRLRFVSVTQWLLMPLALLLLFVLMLGYTVLFGEFVLDSLGWRTFKNLNQSWPLAVALVGILGAGGAIIPIQKLFERVRALEKLGG